MVFYVIFRQATYNMEIPRPIALSATGWPFERGSPTDFCMRLISWAKSFSTCPTIRKTSCVGQHD